MHFQGTVTIGASRQRIWDFLTDPHEVSQCVPGLESLEVLEEGVKFRAVASVGLGNIKARFTTDVEWVDLNPPNIAKMKAHGTAPGSAADVLAEMHLVEAEDGATELQWEAEVNVMGTIAALASRMMGSVTQKLTAQFFNCVKGKVEA